MNSVFLLCAAVGGTVLVCQVIMTLVGLGDDGLEVADDVPDGGDVNAADSLVETGEAIDHGSNWMFGIISFRTLVAAATFFGMGGLAAQRGGLGVPIQVLIAVGCGAAAMLLVHWMMTTFYRLGQSGNLRVAGTIGKTASVYIPIPASNSGRGKVQMHVQGRIAEFDATTSSAEKLVTGAKVVVVGVVGGSTLEVEPLREPVEAEA